MQMPDVNWTHSQTHHYLHGLRLTQLVNLLAGPQANEKTNYDAVRHAGLMQLLADWSLPLAVAKGSSHNHQAWEGGLKDHMAAMLRIAVPLYLRTALDFKGEEEKIPYTLQQVVLVVLLHDAEKWPRYGPPEHPLCTAWHHKAQEHAELSAMGLSEPDLPTAWYALAELIIEEWDKRYNLSITGYERNALKYAHGEAAESHSKNERLMKELGAFLHMLDTESARIGHSHGQGLG
ncbi:MAG: hypothetical protein COY40_00410 [Alphaproteobacteria bacterium CG_4_10_14_0_8_um_filter_53_9]|nr:MAG: hypothetical protein COY40_00410 [Alphaproteobacteria bacterium CG_4_10_14_0_8_um_filter_53_9]